MKFHIVRTGETVEDILFLYNLTKDELVEENRHIRVWDRLIPGTKLKIPPLTEAIEDDVSEMEPFVEDYYPKLSDEEIETAEVAAFQEDDGGEQELDFGQAESIKSIEITKDGEKIVSEKPKIKTATKPQDYPSYYLGHYNYPRYFSYNYLYYPIYYRRRR
ncbi:MAG: LysM peptidoglycan-binding domain-containing protein [Bacilli bacterium]|jgi:hypothetical protein|nr:LysM peptidoglycan-binding domain-containing protein [Acholeplasmataceae bacterium]